MHRSNFLTSLAHTQGTNIVYTVVNITITLIGGVAATHVSITTTTHTTMFIQCENEQSLPT